MDLGDTRILHPAFALLALLVPVVMLLSARVRRGTLRFSSIAPFRDIRPSWRLRLRVLVPLLRSAALLLLVAALCRPQKGSELAPERSRGIGIMLVVDNSESMTEEDFRVDGERVSRIEAVKVVARDFIKGDGKLSGRPHDEIGLVSFSGYPIPRAPLTLDHGAILDVLATVKVTDRRELGRDRALLQEELSTATGDAIALAASRLRDAEVKSKVMILLSDGRQTSGELDPIEGATVAEAFGIKIYTIGIGQAGWVMRTINDPLFGPRQIRRRSDLDEATLREVAKKTGGRYFNAANTDALRQVYEAIDELEQSDIETTRFYRWDERFVGLALAGLACLVLELLLGQTVFRRVP